MEGLKAKRSFVLPSEYMSAHYGKSIGNESVKSLMLNPLPSCCRYRLPHKGARASSPRVHNTAVKSFLPILSSFFHIHFLTTPYTAGWKPTPQGLQARVTNRWPLKIFSPFPYRRDEAVSSPAPSNPRARIHRSFALPLSPFTHHSADITSLGGHTCPKGGHTLSPRLG